MYVYKFEYFISDVLCDEKAYTHAGNVLVEVDKEYELDMPVKVDHSYICHCHEAKRMPKRWGANAVHIPPSNSTFFYI